MNRADALFAGWEDTLIRSALQGLMGWVRAEGNAAVAMVGDFALLAGDGSSPEALGLLYDLARERKDGYLILTPDGPSWDAGIMLTFPSAQAGVRYAIQKEADVFDRERLTALARALPPEITLAPIDGQRYDQVMESDWCRDFCALFGSKEDYLQNGLGFVALRNGEIVGGASSYAYYRGGIEIEVDTRKDMRRRGIAAACCAQLILACLDRGLYPSWDAANLESVALAKKLGYHEKGLYAVWIREEENSADG